MGKVKVDAFVLAMKKFRLILTVNTLSRIELKDQKMIDLFIHQNFVHPILGPGAFKGLDDFQFFASIYKVAPIEVKKSKGKESLWSPFPTKSVDNVQQHIESIIRKVYFKKPGKTLAEQKSARNIARLLSAYQMYLWRDLLPSGIIRPLRPSELILVLSQPLDATEQNLPRASASTKQALQNLAKKLILMEKKHAPDKLDERTARKLIDEAKQADMVPDTVSSLSPVETDMVDNLDKIKNVLKSKGVILPKNEYESADAILRAIEHEYDVVQMDEDTTMDDMEKHLSTRTEAHVKDSFDKSEDRKLTAAEEAL